MGGGGSFARMGGAGPNHAASAGRIAGTRGGRTWNGGAAAFAGGPRGWNGGWHQRGWWPGAAVVTGAALGSYAYYGGPDYYDDSYYDTGPDDYDSGAVVAPAPVGGDVDYCAQRYRSYDPASGTYLGYDGLRHPCP